MSENMIAYLKLVGDKDGQETVWTLADQSTYRLGREKTTDIMLPYSWVSRKHAMIQVENNGRHNLIDLGSSNGTFVNGKRIYTPTQLNSGDCIGIGNTRLTFYQEDSAPPAESAGPNELDERTVAFVQKETVTILICDIHDFTPLAEKIGDRLISQLLQHWTGQVNKIVQNNQGVVDKFIGDAVMALWAGGNPPKKNIHLALRTALDINAFTLGLNHTIPGIPWQLRIGSALNTGEAMFGNLGVEGLSNYTVVGDVVNVAFRLEDLTSQKQGLDLVMGQEAATQLSNIEPFFKAQTFSVKGKTEPVTAYGCSFSQLAQYLGQPEGDLPVKTKNV
jgi:adenylate cyclase